MSAAAATATALIGRCAGCGQAFRAEIPAGVVVCASTATGRAREHGYPTWHHCRAGVRCPGDPGCLPACGDWECQGHDLTEIRYRALKVTYTPGVKCSGSCWQAKSSNCTCSCAGKSHGRMWAS